MEGFSVRKRATRVIATCAPKDHQNAKHGAEAQLCSNQHVASGWNESSTEMCRQN